jgi:hypothetical protein
MFDSAKKIGSIPVEAYSSVAVRNVEQTRYVDSGFVGCPIHNCDADIERCYACPRLIRVNLQADSPYIVCRSNIR